MMVQQNAPFAAEDQADVRRQKGGEQRDFLARHQKRQAEDGPGADDERRHKGGSRDRPEGEQEAPVIA